MKPMNSHISDLLNFAILSLIFTLLSCSGSSFDPNADKTEFYKSDAVFLHVQSNETKTLKWRAYECMEVNSDSYHGSLPHDYSIGEFCGQQMRESDNGLFVLDHSIRSEDSNIQENIRLFFEEDIFRIPRTASDTTYRTTTYTWQGNILEDVYVLTPLSPAELIDSLYYARGIGILKAFTRKNGEWMRVE